MLNLIRKWIVLSSLVSWVQLSSSAEMNYTMLDAVKPNCPDLTRHVSYVNSVANVQLVRTPDANRDLSYWQFNAEGRRMLFPNQSYVQAVEFPFYVLIVFGKTQKTELGKETGICGGTIVHKNKVLTSWNCIDKHWKAFSKQQTNCKVYAGVTSLRPEDMNDERSKQVLSCASRENGTADLAIITLAESLNYSSTVKPVCIWNSRLHNNKSLVANCSSSPGSTGCNGLLIAEPDKLNPVLVGFGNNRPNLENPDVEYRIAISTASGENSITTEKIRVCLEGSYWNEKTKGSIANCSASNAWYPTWSEHGVGGFNFEEHSVKMYPVGNVSKIGIWIRGDTDGWHADMAKFVAPKNLYPNPTFDLIADKKIPMGEYFEYEAVFNQWLAKPVEGRGINWVVKDAKLTVRNVPINVFNNDIFESYRLYQTSDRSLSYNRTLGALQLSIVEDKEGQRCPIDFGGPWLVVKDAVWYQIGLTSFVKLHQQEQRSACKGTLISSPLDRPDSVDFLNDYDASS